MAFTKTAHAEARHKVAEVEAFDREQGFEFGFTKAAQDLGLTQDEFKTFYEIGCADLEKSAQAAPKNA